MKCTFLPFAPIPYKTWHIWRLLNKILWKSQNFRKFHKKSLFQHQSPTPYKTSRILRLLRSRGARNRKNPDFWRKGPPETCPSYIKITPNHPSDFGTNFSRFDHFRDFLPAGAPEIPKILLPTVGFETWCEKVRKSSEKLKNQIFDKSHFKNCQM